MTGLVTGLLLVFAAHAVPDDPWVQFDRAVTSGPIGPGPAITNDAPARIDITVPRLGLERVDVRFHVASEAGPQVAPQGAVMVELRDPENELVWSSDLELEIVPNDDWTQLLIPHISQAQHEQIALVLTPKGVPDGTTVAIWQIGCDCLSMARLSYSDDSTGADAGDADAAYFAKVPSKVERLRVVLDRLNRTHPPGFGAKATVAWAIIAAMMFVATLGVLVWISMQGQR